MIANHLPLLCLRFRVGLQHDSAIPTATGRGCGFDLAPRSSCSGGLLVSIDDGGYGRLGFRDSGRTQRPLVPSLIILLGFTDHTVRSGLKGCGGWAVELMKNISHEAIASLGDVITCVGSVVASFGWERLSGFEGVDCAM